MKALAAVVVVAGFASHAHAQAPGLTPVAETPAPLHKSETVATAATVAGIVVPAALVAYGLRPGVEAGDGAFMLGTLGAVMALPLPAAGQWYSGHWGGYGMGMRFIGVIALGVGASYIDDANRCDRGEQVVDGCFDSDRAVGRGAIALGIGVSAASWVYDVIAARRGVREWNARHESRMLAVPLVAPHTVGLAVGAAF